MTCLNLSDQEILKVIEPMVDSAMVAASRRDYAAHSAAFSISLKGTVSPEAFLAGCDRRQKQWGRARERELVCIFRKDKSFTVVWNQAYDSTEDQVLLLVTVALKGGRYFIDHLLIH